MTPPGRATPPPAGEPSASPGLPALRAHILGEVRLAVGDRSLSPEAWPRRAARSLLLLLLATDGHRLAREQAADLLWSDLPPERVRNTWYQALSTMRRVLEPNLPPRQASAFLEVSAAEIALRPRPDAWIDVDAFESALRAAGSGPPTAERDRLRAAVALYRGDLLAGEPAADWATIRREELRLTWQRAVLRLADLDREAGDPLASVVPLREILAGDPTAEEAHRALIRAFAAAGHRARALRQYEQCCRTLRDELGVDPSEETLDLGASLQAAAPDPQSRGAIRPERPGTAPPLPVPATSLVGRTREVELVQDLLWQPDVRLVTLTGPGGIGKTRLAIEVARLLADDFDGVAFVPLAAVRSPQLLLAAVGQALGLDGGGSVPIRERVRHRIGDRELLLVLDNVEHLTDAVDRVAGLLTDCRRLMVLATSRTRLRLTSEHVVEVPPLALPSTPRASLAALARSEAVSLFAQRARAAKADFALTDQNTPTIARLCARLDGLPLAIELAAARVTVLSPRAILTRFDRHATPRPAPEAPGTPLDLLAGGPRDAPLRQQTMRAAVDWSYDLLGDDERLVVRRLAVFAGGFTLDAAERVVPNSEAQGPSPEIDSGLGRPYAVLELLASLVDKSLLRQEEQADGEPRFGMLETIRAYALERLAASGEIEATGRAHAAVYLALAEQAEPALKGPQQASWLDRLEAEQPNLRAALTWADEHGEIEVGLRLAGALTWFWWTRGHPSEGHGWLTRLLARGGDAPAVRAKALNGAGVLGWAHGDYQRAVASAEEALTLWRSLGDGSGIAASLRILAIDAYGRGDYERATALFDEALALFRANGDVWGTVNVLGNLAMVAGFQGDVERAEALLGEAIALARNTGDLYHAAALPALLARLAHRRGDLSQAATLYLESIASLARLGDTRPAASSLRGLARIAAARGDVDRAARLAGAEASLRDDFGTPLTPLPEREAHERDVAAWRLALGEAAFAAAWAVGQAMGLDRAIAEAEAIAAASVEGETEVEPAARSNVVPLRPYARRRHRSSPG